MDLTNITDLKLALNLAGLRANKGLGQHFLVDQPSLQAVMAAGELESDDLVLEIGPGLGVLTEPLTRTVRQVVAVEADIKLAGLLQRDAPPNLQVVTDDIMHFDLTGLPPGYKVVANIPYYATSAIIRLLMESSNPPALIALLVQKEVAERIVAQPGSLSILALSVQYYGAPRLTQVVERDKFWPPPKIDSAVIQVRRYAQPAFAADSTKLFRLIKAGFGEKRKMLKNSLAGGLKLEAGLAIQLVAEAGLAPTARAQELSLPEWQRLYQCAVQHELLE